MEQAHPCLLHEPSILRLSTCEDVKHAERQAQESREGKQSDSAPAPPQHTLSDDEPPQPLDRQAQGWRPLVAAEHKKTRPSRQSPVPAEARTNKGRGSIAQRRSAARAYPEVQELS
jgi:hypothetical protein